MEDNELAFEPEELDVPDSDSDEDFEVGEKTDISEDLHWETHLNAAYDAIEESDEDEEENPDSHPLPNSAKAERMSEEVMDRALEAGYEPEVIEAISQISDPVELASAIEAAEQEVAEVHQRELQGLQEQVQQVAPLQQVSQYWSGYLNQLGVDPAQAINGLLSTEHTLRTGTPKQRRQALDYLKQTYAIESSEEDGFDVYEDPQVKQLRSEIQQLRNGQQQFYQYQQQQHEAFEKQGVESEIEAFQNETDENGQPAHPLMEFVQDEMAGLIKAGLANSLKEAYEKAVLVNPDTRAELEMQKRQVDAHMRKMRAAKAEKAKRANVKARTSTNVVENFDSWEDELSAAFDRVNT